MGGNGGGGNTRDNRQRGNAAQLLEKYKNMARDSQLAGDRVQTEYYLQFADHYFRVLGESRSRFEEQRRARGDYEDDEGFDDDNGDSDGDDDGSETQDRDDRQERQDRQERPDRQSRGEPRERYNRERQTERAENDDSDNGGETEVRPARFERAPRPRLNPRRESGPEPVGANEGTIAMASLPPAIGASAAGEEGGDEAAPRRRRTRRPRADEGDGEVAPAA